MDKKEFRDQLTNLHLKQLLTRDIEERQEIQYRIDKLSSEYKRELVESKKQVGGGKTK